MNQIGFLTIRTIGCVVFKLPIAVIKAVSFVGCLLALCDRVVWYKCILAIVIIMEAARISETSVNAYQTTRRNNPEDSHLHVRRLQNLKSDDVSLVSQSTRHENVWLAWM
jgi:hypothetical protein